MACVIIDDRPVDVTDGSNLLAAARKLGIDIPSLCYHPGCAPNTTCMVCVVRLKSSGRIVPACAAPAVEGEVVESETPEVHALRRVALELLLSDHPGACPALRALDGLPGPGTVAAPDAAAPAECAHAAPVDCDCTKENNCRLRKYAVLYQVRPDRFRGAQRAAGRRDDHPEITFDAGKCILCGICVQLAQQDGQAGLALVGRGFDVRVAAPLDVSLVEALGAAARRCAAACPTSALALRAAPAASGGGPAPHDTRP